MNLGRHPDRPWSVRGREFRRDGDLVGFFASVIVHVLILVLLGLAPAFRAPEADEMVITTLPPEPEIVDETPIPEEFHFSDAPAEEFGALSVHDAGAALSLAQLVDDVSEIPSPVELTPTSNPIIEINHAIDAARGLHYSENLTVRGAAGAGVTGADGAIDRITQEILMSLEERKTLVVWLFDQSGSLHRQRGDIHERLDRIYEELGVIEAQGNPAFADHDDKPLLSSVVAFGEEVTLRTETPTDDVEAIKAAVRGIEMDDSGVERVFSAVYMAANAYKDLRVPPRGTREPDRNVMLIVVTDEAGEDQNGLEDTVALCRRYEIPVYVIGVPAPFGRRETLVKWVDPDPNYDQSPQWGRVEQGPESLLPERIRLHFAGTDENATPIDSGFGPFALTRLAYETGGIYFAVHPNRRTSAALRRRQVDPFSAHLERFFDPDVMLRYRPDYVSSTEYMRQLNANRARASLVAAAQLSWVAPMEDPQLRFLRRDEASFANALREAQKEAAKLEPALRRLYEILREGEPDRETEISPRWQAGFDLAMGRVMAVMVRTETYNAMLARAKRGLRFSDENNNTWVLEPAEDIDVSSQLTNAGERAREYLQRVVDEHPGTPWALLAQRELDTPMGWRWREEFTDLSPPPARRPGNNATPPPTPRTPRDDQATRLNRPPPRRPVPKL